MRRKIILISIFTLIYLTLFAATNTWQGDTSHSWSDGNNWSLGHEPYASEDVVIPDVGDYPYITASGGYSASCRSVEIESGAMLRIANGTLTVTYDVDVYGSIWMSSSNAVLDVNDDIFWRNGSSESISYGNIYVADNWTFENGTSFTPGSDNTVTFDGSSSQSIYAYDSNSYFANLVIDNSASVIWLSNSSTYDIHVNNDLTLTNDSRLQVETTTLTIDETLDIEDGSKIYLEDVGGEMELNSDFTLNGELDIDGGDVLCHGEFELASTGILTIDGGSFIDDGIFNHMRRYIRGNLNISDGLFEIRYNDLYITSTCTSNITDGTIKVGDAFTAIYAGTFQPSGGTVELTANNISTVFKCSNGNYFYNLTINSTIDNIVYPSTDILIQNNLEIVSGKFSLHNEYEVTVNNNVNIYDQLKLAYANDILSVGNDIIWHSGSDDYDLTNGTINISGNWYFNDGTNAQLGTGNTVNFVGSTTQNIYCYDADAAFGSVDVDKSGGNLIINAGSSYPMQVDGDMDLISVNDFYLQNEDLVVEGTLDIYNGSTLNIGTLGSLTNNSDFTLNGELDVGEGDAFIHREFELVPTGILTIDGGSFICSDEINDTSYIYGELNISDGLLAITNGNLTFGSSSTNNISGGIIRCGHIFTVANGTTFNPTGGVIDLTGTSIMMIMGSGTSLYDLLITGSIYPQSSQIFVTNDLTVDGTLFLNDDLVQVDNEMIINGGIRMDSALDVLSVENIFWNNGSTSGQVTNGNINVHGDWYFHDGTDAQLGTGNTVNFYGSTTQNIYCYDADAAFGSVGVDKSGGNLIINTASTQPMRVDGDFDAIDVNSFHINGEELIVDGTLDIYDGSEMTLGIDGALTNNSDFELNGELDVGSTGDALIHGEFDLASTGILTIDGGSFVYDEGTSTYPLNIRGTFNMSEGLFHSLERFGVDSSASITVTGGMIRVNSFRAEYSGTYQPAGGTVEIQTDNGGLGWILCSNGNFFRNLSINPTSGGGGALHTDIIVQNDLEITSGQLRFNEYEATVNNDVNIYSKLSLDETTDILNVGNDITWYSGSSSEYVTDGTINVSGDWYFNDGTDAQLGTGNTVNFIGSGSQLIYNFDDNASFGNVTIDKPDITPVWLDNSSTHDFQIDGDLTLTNTSRLQVQSNTLTVDGTLDIENGSKMYLENAGGEIINNSDFTLNGELEIDGGDALFNHRVVIHPTGEINLYDGNLSCDTFEYYGSLLLNSGIIQTNQFIGHNGGTSTVSGGEIKTNYFSTMNTGNFTPTDGTVELNYFDDLTGEVRCYNDNYLHNLEINFSGDYVKVGSDSLLIQNDFTLSQGRFILFQNEVTVNNNLEIYDRLDITNSSEILTIGNNINWYSGSNEIITNGIINVSGDWYFHDGTDAQLGTGNTVNFVGSENSSIYCNDDNACFGNVVVDKDTSND